jgi:hypothetical protein
MLECRHEEHAMNKITAPEARNLSLVQGPFWPSFEQFRLQGNAGLQELAPGSVGTLLTKQGQFRIMAEEDFQRLQGLAADVRRLSGGLRVVFAAARALQRNRDEASLETLSEAVMMLGDLPALPTRDRFEPLKPEGLDLEEESGDLDLDNVARPVLNEAKDEPG